MRTVSLTFAALLLGLPLFATAPAQAGMIGPVQPQAASDTANAIDTVALRHHRRHRHVRHRHAIRHHHAVRHAHH